MQTELYHKCASCKILREDSEYEVHKNVRRKSCLKCKRKRIKLKADVDKNHIKTILSTLESKIDSLSLRPIQKTLDDYVKIDCKDAVKLTDFIGGLTCRRESELVQVISKSYLALKDNNRPFKSRDKELFVHLQEWKRFETGDVLLAAGEEILNGPIKLDDEFIEAMLELSLKKTE